MLLSLLLVVYGGASFPPPFCVVVFPLLLLILGGAASFPPPFGVMMLTPVGGGASFSPCGPLSLHRGGAAFPPLEGGAASFPPSLRLVVLSRSSSFLVALFPSLLHFGG